MCAHVCSIFIRTLSITDPQEFLRVAKQALGAPGCDATLGFEFEYGWDYSALYDACEAGDARKAREIMDSMLGVMNPVLMHYGSFEEFVRTKMEFWKPNTPWAKSRYAKFHTASGFDHAKAGSGAPYMKKAA